VNGRGQGEGGEMTQTLYAHRNKIKIFKKQINTLIQMMPFRSQYTFPAFAFTLLHLPSRTASHSC
jgi:hypothetical protein